MKHTEKNISENTTVSTDNSNTVHTHADGITHLYANSTAHSLDDSPFSQTLPREYQGCHQPHEPCHRAHGGSAEHDRGRS